MIPTMNAILIVRPGEISDKDKADLKNQGITVIAVSDPHQVVVVR